MFYALVNIIVEYRNMQYKPIGHSREPIELNFPTLFFLGAGGGV
jgi:hypothetical protein